MAQILVKDLQKKREELVEQHRQATLAVEQTRGAIYILDELIKELSADGAEEISDAVETTNNTERHVST